MEGRARRGVFSTTICASKDWILVEFPQDSLTLSLPRGHMGMQVSITCSESLQRNCNKFSRPTWPASSPSTKHQNGPSIEEMTESTFVDIFPPLDRYEFIWHSPDTSHTTTMINS